MLWCSIRTGIASAPVPDTILAISMFFELFETDFRDFRPKLDTKTRRFFGERSQKRSETNGHRSGIESAYGSRLRRPQVDPILLLPAKMNRWVVLLPRCLRNHLILGRARPKIWKIHLPHP